MVITMPTYLQKEVVWGLPAWKMLAVLIVFLCFGFIPCRTALAAGMRDIKGDWAAAEIEQAVSTGYVKGYPDGTFRPNDEVTRAEFVAMVDGAFQVPAGQAENTLKDVSTRDWFAQDVSSALAAEFVGGYADGTFRPQQEVSRQEAACMLARLLKLDGTGDPGFSDAGAVGNWAKTSVSGLVTAGIMSGYPDGTFKPQKAVTRAEAVVMINQALAFQAITPVTDQLQVTGDVVNVRSCPNTSARVIGQAHDGDTLQAKAKNGGDWYQIDYQGSSGWIAGQYVQDFQPASAPGSTAPDSVPAEPSRDNLAALSVQVSQDDNGTTVDIQGAPDSTCQLTEENDPQILDVTVTGITLVRTPLEIDVGSGAWTRS